MGHHQMHLAYESVMDCSIEKKIKINQLLLERECAFVQIHEIENEIEASIGHAYPFRRCSLPSDFYKPKKRGNKNVRRFNK